MLSMRYAALNLAIMLAILGGSALAQLPDGAVVNTGNLNQLASGTDGSFSLAATSVKPMDGSAMVPAAVGNNSSVNSSLMNATINATMINSTAGENIASSDSAASEALDLAPSSGKEVLDLSRYARDRTNNSLAGYTNIMYPITGSRGTTTSTSGGGGSGCGCG